MHAADSAVGGMGGGWMTGDEVTQLAPTARARSALSLCSDAACV